jgi:hypothetical protein
MKFLLILQAILLSVTVYSHAVHSSAIFLAVSPVFFLETLGGHWLGFSFLGNGF